MEIVRKANPQSLDELERNSTFTEYREMDLSPFECMTMGLGVPTGYQRVAVVYAVDRNDANKMYHIAKVLGPATGTNRVSVPANGNVEWAWVQEMVEMRASQLNEKIAARAIRLHDLQKSINTQLPDIADNMEKVKRGHSTFGEHGFIQRVS